MKKSKRQVAKHSQPLTDLVYGKVPPQSKDIEEVVLGAIMLEKGAIDIAQEILSVECFYVDAHQRIFRSMQDLNSKGQPIDILTVVENLRSKEELEIVGGPYFVTRLTNSVTSAASIDTHCRIIFQKFIQREIIRIGQEMVIEGYEESTDPFDLLEKAEKDVLGITLNNLKGDFAHIESGLIKAIKRIEELRHRDDQLTGVPSRFTELDNCTNGWQDTDLIILAARPAVGKTAFALNLTRNAAMDPEKPTPVGYFSLEMSTLQLVQRMLSAETGIPLEKIRNGKLDDAQMVQLYQNGVSRISQAPIYIDDTAGLNIYQLKAKARRMKRKHNIGMIIIDYLQLMNGDKKSGNREQEISKISRDLKELAKDLCIPVIALSQMSRDVEKRGAKEPQLSDLRESGAIEQDADLVMFLYRPSKEDVEKDADLRGKGTVKVAKHRNGTLEDIVLRFRGEIQRWENLDAPPGNWRPIIPPINEPVNNYYEPKKKEEEDLPF